MNENTLNLTHQCVKPHSRLPTREELKNKVMQTLTEGRRPNKYSIILQPSGTKLVLIEKQQFLLQSSTLHNTD